MKINFEIHSATGDVCQGRDYDDQLVPLKVVGEDACVLATHHYTYQDGDVIAVKTQPKSYLMVRFDETLKEDLVYLPTGEMNYLVSLSQNAKEARSDLAFSGEKHYLSARRAHRFEVEYYRNLTENTHDQKDENGAFPHAHANVETRDDATFFACNAIDGDYANRLHGAYPYQSWGINQQADAALTIEFGRLVEVSRVGFCLRADFPHDSYWEKVTLAFSDGVEEEFALEKTGSVQYFSFAHQVTTSVTFKNLIKASDESPFPALTQLAIFGTNVLEQR